MRRFYVNTILFNQEEITMPPDESKHIGKVLRMVVGDALEIINGRGEVFVGEIKSVESKSVIVHKIDFKTGVPDDYHIHIAIAPTKNNDRFEWFLEKATELGIHEITPILCKNSERSKINFERFNKILVAGIKQSKRLFLPKLNDLIPFDKFVKQFPDGFIAHCYEDQEVDVSLHQQLQTKSLEWKNKNTPILIGPEGDFTLNEIENAIKNGYEAVTLGKTRLRTETAGVYACMNVKLFFEEQ